MAVRSSALCSSRWHLVCGVRHRSCHSHVATAALPWQRMPELNGVVYQTEVPKPWLPTMAEGVSDAAAAAHTRRGAIMLHATDLVPPEVLQRARSLIDSMRFDEDADSVDGQPTFEVQWISEGRYTHRALADVFRSTVEERIVPLLKASQLASQIRGHGEGNLVLCEGLVRCYDEGARRVHPAHYDGDALATAVFEVPMGENSQHMDECSADARGSSSSNGDGSSDGDGNSRGGGDCSRSPASSEGGVQGFRGPGFYVQPGAHVSTRLPIKLAPGDLIAHSFDLQHGVEVSAGKRCSVVLWFTDSIASCRDKTRPWYVAAAERGEPDAQYNLGRNLDRAGSDPRRAIRLLRSAAEQGSFVAMNDLAGMLMAGRGCPNATPDLVEAEGWLRRAAGQGFHRSMVGLARIHAGRGERGLALEWLTRAAEQRAEPETCYKLGMAHLYGLSGTAVNADLGERWLREAAEMGHPRAQAEVGSFMLKHYDAVRHDAAGEADAAGMSIAGEAEEWLARAARQGERGATRQLMRLYCARADAHGVWRLVTGIARRNGRLSSKFSLRAKMQLATTLLAVPALLVGGGIALGAAAH